MVRKKGPPAALTGAMGGRTRNPERMLEAERKLALWKAKLKRAEADAYERTVAEWDAGEHGTTDVG